MLGKKSRDKGKRFELEIANLLGIERTGTRGKPDKEHEDLIHSRFFLQCKMKSKLAISDWFNINSEMADEANKIPVLIMRTDRDEPLAIFRLTDVLEMFRMDSGN